MQAMRTLHHQPMLRIATVALLMVSWLLFTHHCVLGMMQSTGEAMGNPVVKCCGGKTKSKQDVPDSNRTCCKIKVTTASAKAAVKFDASHFVVLVFPLMPGLAAPQTEPRRAVQILDHGPPRCLSFAELVLQRSLLSLAPPFLA